jgi:MoxR-like ATPase
LKMAQLVIDGVELELPRPAELDLKWVGRDDLVRQVLAAWMVVDKRDRPMNPRLVGRPGVGKTTLAYAAAKRLGCEIYLFQATMDTRPEDLIVSPVVGPDNTIRYAASSLVAAALRGGVCILDEGNRMSEKSWASLAPLLDDRRYVESLLTGLQLKAHPDFRLAVTMNEDASTFEIPEYIHTRLMPQIHVDFPEEDEERAILKENLPFAPDELLSYMTTFLQAAHRADEPYSVRDGINTARYALKLGATEGGEALEFVERALEQVLGAEALHYLPGRVTPFGRGPQGREE